jgi:hypothetical protein
MVKKCIAMDIKVCAALTFGSQHRNSDSETPVPYGPVVHVAARPKSLQQQTWLQPNAADRAPQRTP